jgi:hypothetical protein
MPLQMINIGTSKIYPWGWRLSLGLCMVPATTLLLGGIFLDDTPNSLCERGYPEKVCRTYLLHHSHIQSMRSKTASPTLDITFSQGLCLALSLRKWMPTSTAALC